MLDQQQYSIVKKIVIGVSLLGLFWQGTAELFTLSYCLAWLLMILRALLVPSQKRLKLALPVAYTAILVVQIVFNVSVIFEPLHSLATFYISKFFGVILLVLPLVIEMTFTYRKYYDYQLPSVQELSVVSFAEIKNNQDLVLKAMEIIDRAGKSVSKENIEEIVSDLPRHNSLRYINNGSLTDEYFEKAYSSLSDENIYIVISDTGSPASELISTFTQKHYNHASLAFDEELSTIISYNGGERVYPPGLNHEMISFFNKKEDSSILVYRLAASREQKKLIVDKVKEINGEGSAYNIMGLVFKYSHKPNILYCSQFVYKMLKLADLAYFEKKENDIKPTDLIELDYHRRLQFAYELKLKEAIL